MRMKYGPTGTVPTVNVNGFKTPLAVKVQAPALVIIAGAELEIWEQGATKLPASVDAKLVPDTVTSVPAGPDDGVNVIVGPVTVNMAWPMSPAPTPVTSTTYCPVGTLPTLNENAFNTPLLVKVQAPGLPALITGGVGLEIWGQGATKLPASAGAKPLPDTVTIVPTGPDVGRSEIVGALLVTVNLA
jgi:hypothetical protein